MTDTKATPRPWRLGAGGKVYAGDARSPILIATVHAQGPEMDWIPNAEALVTAVNAYELHGAIGCTKVDAYRELEAAARPICEGAKATLNSDWLCPHGNRPSFPTHAWWCDGCFFRFEAALAAAEGKEEAR